MDVDRQRAAQDRVNPLNTEALARLQAVMRPGPVLILAHHNPDPDALAAGAGLAYLLEYAWGIASHKAFSGLVARAENVAMLRHLTPGWIEIESLEDAPKHTAIALVDSQPGAGNNLLPDEHVPEAVFDHHEPFRPPSGEVAYLDLRPEMGATATLIYQHLEVAGLPIPPRLATALFYGIKTDTRGLSRGTAPGDEAAYLSLLANVDRAALLQVEYAKRPPVFFKGVVEGLATARVHQSAVVAELDEMHRSDFAADLADQLIALEGTRGVLCLGRHKGVLQLSVRTIPMGEDAGLLIQELVAGLGKGGGHGTIAGGQVVLTGEEPTVIAAEIADRFLTLMGERETPGKLLIQSNNAPSG